MDLMMNEFKQLALAMGIALILVLAVVAWKSFPSKDVYISDMDFEVVKFEWTQPQRDQSIAGSSMIINEKYYEKGLAMHAHSEVNVPVPAGYTHFLAEVGVDDAMKDDAPSSVQFQVLGDGGGVVRKPHSAGLHAGSPGVGERGMDQPIDPGGERRRGWGQFRSRRLGRRPVHGAVECGPDGGDGIHRIRDKTLANPPRPGIMSPVL